MTHVTCRLTAKNRDQLRNPTLGYRVSNQSNLFAQNTSHFNAATGEAVDEQSHQGSKEHLWRATFLSNSQLFTSVSDSSGIET